MSALVQKARFGRLAIVFIFGKFGEVSVLFCELDLVTN